VHRTAAAAEDNGERAESGSRYGREGRREKRGSLTVGSAGAGKDDGEQWRRAADDEVGGWMWTPLTPRGQQRLWNGAAVELAAASGGWRRQ
jgi:hypothetical protein